MASAAQVTGAGVRKVLWITLALNVAVSLSKIVVGQLTGSMAMVADGYHSLLDGSNNVVGLVVAGFAYAPPDRAHPYGHRKFETAATLAIGGALLLLAYRVTEGALSGLSHAQVPAIGLVNWLVMGVTLGVNFFVTVYESREGQRLQSAYLVADATHTRSDIYVTLGVVASFAGVRAGLAWADTVVALGIAAFIAYLGSQILVGAFHVLTDRAVIAPEAITDAVLVVAGVRDCRDVRTRGSHGHVYVDLTVHVDGSMTLREAHAVADRIESSVKQAHPEVVDVVVHLEPAEDA